MASKLIARHFAGPRFRTVQEVLEKVDEISRQIQLKTGAKQKPTRFGKSSIITSQRVKLIHEIAPQYLYGRYKASEITLEVLRREGRQISEFEKTYARVAKILIDLKKRGLIPKTTVQDRPRQPKLRDVTPAQVKQHIGLVFHILKKGHNFLVRDWPFYLTRTEAAEIGEDALREALEIHDPARHSLSSIAAPYIAGRISQAVEKKRRDSKIVSMDQPGKRDERTLHEKIAAPDEKQPELHRNLEVLLGSRLLQNHHLAVFALRMYGHQFDEISGQFGAKRQAAHALYKKAVEFLKKRKTLEE